MKKCNNTPRSKHSSSRRASASSVTDSELLKKFKKSTDLVPYFKYTVKTAASMIGVSPSALKDRCRVLNIVRWPYRKLQSIDQHIAKLEKSIREGLGNKQRDQQKIKALEKMKSDIIENPSLVKVYDKRVVRSNKIYKQLFTITPTGTDFVNKCASPSSSSSSSANSSDEELEYDSSEIDEETIKTRARPLRVCRKNSVTYSEKSDDDTSGEDYDMLQDEVAAAAAAAATPMANDPTALLLLADSYCKVQTDVHSFGTQHQQHCVSGLNHMNHSHQSQEFYTTAKPTPLASHRKLAVAFLLN